MNPLEEIIPISKPDGTIGVGGTYQMLIEIESVYGDKIIHGKHIERSDLQKTVKVLLKTVGEQDFSSVFCARYGYEEILYSDTLYH